MLLCSYVLPCVVVCCCLYADVWLDKHYTHYQKPTNFDCVQVLHITEVIGYRAIPVDIDTAVTNFILARPARVLVQRAVLV